MTSETGDYLAVFAAGLLEPLTNRRAGEQIAGRLTTAIALGQYWPGQRLPSERRLAQLLQVSRSSVREALHLLAEAGQLEVRRGSSGGAFITSASSPGAAAMVRRALLPGWARLTQLLDFRCTVEQQVARLAAERATAEDRTAIQLRSEEYLASSSEKQHSQAADRALHKAIARAAHNRFWYDLSLQLHYQVNQGIGTEPFSQELRRRGEEQHPLLAAAVVAGDVERSGELAARHFALNTEAIHHLLDVVGREPRQHASSEAQSNREAKVKRTAKASKVPKVNKKGA
jgi:GntR family transcriptional regulator, transcriptional repressor for pyruvate dehydrogenase complex